MHPSIKTSIGCVLFLIYLSIFPADANSLTTPPEKWIPFFEERFETGKSDMLRLEPGLAIEKDLKGNRFLIVKDRHDISLYPRQMASNYRFQCRVQMPRGSIQLHYCSSEKGAYIAFLSTTALALRKATPDGKIRTLVHKSGFNWGSPSWHSVELSNDGVQIRMSVDGSVLLRYQDPHPLNIGAAAFETAKGTLVLIDDIVLSAQLELYPVLHDKWIPTGGPSGGLGYDIRIHPSDKNIMFVTDNPSGVNKSTDAGESWVQKNTGIETRAGESKDGIPVFSLTIDPTNRNRIWAGVQEARGIFFSADTGETWIEKDTGVIEIDTISFRGFAVNPRNSDTVLTATQILTKIPGREFELSSGKIYRTTNSGENWSPVWEGPSLARVLIYDHKHPNIVYCSTGIFDAEATNSNDTLGDPGGVGILKSVQGGKSGSWRQINSGLGNNLHLGFLEMHPTNTCTLYAAAHNNAYRSETYGGLFRTTDRGNSWTRLKNGDNPLFDSFTVITLSKSNPEVVYAGTETAIYRSTDEGTNWTKLWKDSDKTWGPPGIMAGFPISAVVDPDNPWKVYVNNYGGGNFVSEDSGRTWRNASRGYSGADMRDIAVNPRNSDTVYTVGRSGPFKSVDGGFEWQGMAYGTGLNAQYAVAVFPDSVAHILASQDGKMSIVKSTDTGRTWHTVMPDTQRNILPSDRHGIVAIAISPSNPAYAYAGAWKCQNLGMFDPDNKVPSYGVFKSTDRGENWSQCNGNIQDDPYLTKIITVIAVHPMNPDIVYVGTYNDGILKTTNGGSDWVVINDGLGALQIRSLAIHPAHPETVFAGSGDGTGIFKTTDGGDNWEEVNGGVHLVCPPSLSRIGKLTAGISYEVPRLRLPIYYPFIKSPWTRIFDIAIDPINPDRIFIADLREGVYVSENSGSTWTQINEGLNIKAVTCLSLSSDGKVLYAGTSGGGVYRMNLTTLIKPISRLP
jgi:photosystem II stability/assembly factor-like uncharacterized protein